MPVVSQQRVVGVSRRLGADAVFGMSEATRGTLSDPARELASQFCTMTNCDGCSLGAFLNMKKPAIGSDVVGSSETALPDRVSSFEQLDGRSSSPRRARRLDGHRHHGATGRDE